MVAIPAIDFRGIEPSGPTQDTVPDGVYRVVVISSEMKDTKDKTGRYLQLDRKVIDGEHAGKIIPSRHNVVNANETAVRIAMQELSAFAHVIGVMLLNDTAQLHNIPHQVKYVQTFNEKKEPIGNDIKGYFDMNGNGPKGKGNVSDGGSHSAQAGGGQAQGQQTWTQPAAGPVAQQPPGPAAWGAAPTAAPAAAPQAPAQPTQMPPNGAPQAWGGQPTQQAAQPTAAPAGGGWGAPPANAAPQPAAWGTPPR